MYTEVLESYRDPKTLKPKHRCLVRWRGEHSLAQEIGQMQFWVSAASYWLSLIDCTGQPQRPWHRRIAGKSADWRLARARAHLTALLAVRDAGLPADDVEIERC